MVPVDTFWPEMPTFGNLAQNLKNESWKKIPDLRNFEILGRFGLFQNFLNVVRMVLAPFGWFRVVLARSGF